MGMVRSDVRVLLNSIKKGGQLISARTLTKFLQGVPSSSLSCQVPQEFFGRHREIDFDALLSIASEELLRCISAS